MAPLLPVLDAVVLAPLLDITGFMAPGADVTPLSVRCSGARLVR